MQKMSAAAQAVALSVPSPSSQRATREPGPWLLLTALFSLLLTLLMVIYLSVTSF
jgi:hypothetical protein